MRCFVSIELPENVKSQIFHSFEKLEKSKVCYGNFVKKDNLHLTLKFLRDVPADKLDKLKEELKKIEFRQFPVETGEVGFFPNDKFVKVLWLALNSPDFEPLKKEIDERLSKLGFNEKEKEFSSHITIARINKIKDKPQFFEKVKELAPKKMFFIVDEFSLLKSVLKKEGPEYKILETIPMRLRA